MILEFEMQKVAQDCLDAINQVAVSWWISQGYTVEQTENGPILIGKNAATGQDNPKGVTTTWDYVRESPDNTFYFSSPSEQYPTWRDFMPDVSMGVEKEMPEGWIISENI